MLWLSDKPVHQWRQQDTFGVLANGDQVLYSIFGPVTLIDGPKKVCHGSVWLAMQYMGRLTALTCLTALVKSLITHLFVLIFGFCSSNL